MPESKTRKSIHRSIKNVGGEWFYDGKRAKIVKCPTCKDNFATYPSGQTRFCSPACWRRECIRCGHVFQPRTKRTVYCSPECKRGTAKCEGCGKTFVLNKHVAARFCCKQCFYDTTTPTGSVIADPSGYSMTKVPLGTKGAKLVTRGRPLWMWTHRYVMQQMMGRPLLKTERVHHINGRKDDNRPENLELWKGSHPAGVRTKDYHCAGCRCFEETIEAGAFSCF